MKALTTAEIDALLGSNNYTKKYFAGTYPACVVPTTKRQKFAFISNTDEHQNPGTHWNAFAVNGKTLTFFDSFGRSPWDASFPIFFEKYASQFDIVRFVKLRVQGLESNSCGFFCIHFVDYISAT